MGIYYGNEFYGFFIVDNSKCIYKQIFTNKYDIDAYRKNIRELLVYDTSKLSRHKKYTFMILTTSVSTLEVHNSNTFSVQPLDVYPQELYDLLARDNDGSVRIDIIDRIPDWINDITAE